MIESPLHTSRLQLQLISHSDLEFIHDLLTQKETDQYNALGIPESLEETIATIVPWIHDNQEVIVFNRTWIVEDTTNNEKVGLIGLKLSRDKYRRGEVWCKCHPRYWNKGYATEALNGVLDFGFDECNLHRIQAGCAVENKASIRVLEKVGMIKEGRGRKILPLESGWADNFEFSILETDQRNKYV
ncbi:MAG: GNAT family N-acetyltransferase [Crocinitomicaceae bacterium]